MPPLGLRAIATAALRVFVSAAAIAGTFAPAAGEAGSLSSIVIDHVSVSPSGGHRVWVSVLDADGRPRSGLEAQNFSVKEGLSAVPEVKVTPFADRYRHVDLTLIVDPDLADAAGLSSVARSILGDLRTGDRLRIVGASERFPTVEWNVNDRSRDAMDDRNLASLSSSSAARPYDAVFREVRRSRRLPRDRGSVLLVLTRGLDRGSRAGPLEVMALLRAENRPATISVLLWEGAQAGRDVDRLSRFVQQSGGAVQRVSSEASVERQAHELLGRARGGYLLTFTPPDWDSKSDHHRLYVAVQEQGMRRWTDREFATGDVLVTPWWRGGAVWAAAGALLATIAIGFLALRPRRIGCLVVENGEDRGCLYEIFKVPITIGAASGNDLVFSEPRVSRNHAILDRRAGAFELLDLNSENGTFVNGDRITRRRLSPGDRITFGGVVALIYRTPGPWGGRRWTAAS